MALELSRSVTGVMAGFVVLSSVIAGVLVIGAISGEGVSGVTIAAAIGIVVVVGVATVLAPSWLRAFRIRRIRREMGPLLAAWVGLPSDTEPGDEVCLEWPRAVRAGVTPKVAQRWSDAGLPFTMIRPAQQIGLQLSDVVALRRIFVEAGIEFSSRWDLDGLVVGMGFDGSLYPLRWDLFSRDEVEQQVRVSIDENQLWVSNGAGVLWDAYRVLAERRFGDRWFRRIERIPVGSSGVGQAH